VKHCYPKAGGEHGDLVEVMVGEGKKEWQQHHMRSQKGRKNIPFLDENIPHLEADRGGDVPRALTKKIDPR